jgi:hypothetical protein
LAANYPKVGAPSVGGGMQDMVWHFVCRRMVASVKSTTRFSRILIYKPYLYQGRESLCPNSELIDKYCESSFETKEAIELGVSPKNCQ